MGLGRDVEMNIVIVSVRGHRPITVICVMHHHVCGPRLGRVTGCVRRERLWTRLIHVMSEEAWEEGKSITVVIVRQ